MVDKVAAVVTENLDAIALELRETGELGTLLAKAAAGQPLDAAERRKVKEQLIDLAKAVPALAIFAAPGGHGPAPAAREAPPLRRPPLRPSARRAATRRARRSRSRTRPGRKGRRGGEPEPCASPSSARRPSPSRRSTRSPRRATRWRSSWPSPTGRPVAARSCASRPPRPGRGRAACRCSSRRRCATASWPRSSARSPPTCSSSWPTAASWARTCSGSPRTAP